jgi:predicted Rossmann fold nucleotide-binding protein DprA/Smf involved in DNA uptake
MKKIAVVGSRYMSDYGKKVINQLLVTSYQLRVKNLEIVTIRVMGCNDEVIRKCQELKLKCKVFEGKDFEKLNEEVANYADILVIIEGGKNSGTLLLASKFVEKNKDVYCVPGRITDEGSYATNWLIKEGAIPLVEMEDLTQVLQ